MKALGLDGYFDPVIISARYGFRKPDQRLTAKALAIMDLEPSEVIFVGNDMYRDIYGASRLGIKWRRRRRWPTNGAFFSTRTRCRPPATFRST